MTVFEVTSSIGTWRGVVTPNGLARLEFRDGSRGAADVNVTGASRKTRSPAPGREVRDDDHPAARELREYFAGRRREFTVPIDLAACPPFTRRVLEALCAVPFGTTVTYGDLAARAGSPGGARAAGQAVGSNPVPVVVPCHRVLASGGRRGGFGLGLAAKRALLALEGIATT